MMSKEIIHEESTIRDIFVQMYKIWIAKSINKQQRLGYNVEEVLTRYTSK